LKQYIIVLVLTVFLSTFADAADEPASPSKITLPKMPDISVKIDIPENIDVIKETKAGAVGMDNEYWGEKKSFYFGSLSFDEEKGLRYTEPLEKDAVKNRKHYEHIYYGKILTTIYYRDENGNPCTDDNNEAAIITQRYDKQGNLIEEASFNADGTLKNDWYGFAIYRWTYDEKHLRTQGAFYDAEGKLAKKKFSNTAVNCWRYDDNGNIVVWANYDTDGCIANDILGVAATQYKYDEKKRETMAATYGTDKALANNKNGYAVLLTIYDDESGATLTGYYDKSLKPVEVKGASFVRTIQSEKYSWMETGFYNTAGALRINLSGAAIIRNFTNDKGKTFRQKIYDTNRVLKEDLELDENTGKWRRRAKE
jgi:YD repeat-containing protein